MLVVLRGVLISCLFLFYPYLVYLGIKEGMVLFAPLVIASIYLVQGIKAKKTAIRLNKLGAVLFILLGTYFFQEEVAKFKPTLVYLDENNDITHMRHSIPVQAA